MSLVKTRQGAYPSQLSSNIVGNDSWWSLCYHKTTQSHHGLVFITFISAESTHPSHRLNLHIRTIYDKHYKGHFICSLFGISAVQCIRRLFPFHISMFRVRAHWGQSFILFKLCSNSGSCWWESCRWIADGRRGTFRLLLNGFFLLLLAPIGYCIAVASKQINPSSSTLVIFGVYTGMMTSIRVIRTLWHLLLCTRYRLAFAYYVSLYSMDNLPTAII